MYVVVCILKKSLKSPDVLLVYLKNVSIFCSAYIEIDNTEPLLLLSISDGVGDIFETRKLRIFFLHLLEFSYDFFIHFFSHQASEKLNFRLKIPGIWFCYPPGSHHYNPIFFALGGR